MNAEAVIAMLVATIGALWATLGGTSLYLFRSLERRTDGHLGALEETVNSLAVIEAQLTSLEGRLRELAEECGQVDHHLASLERELATGQAVEHADHERLIQTLHHVQASLTER
ncbi:MAG TPA: hypothetical protein VHS99_20140 [Chloroflexota bacterium]|nr:hypothetical protein [Chloroflexota bacterium]